MLGYSDPWGMRVVAVAVDLSAQQQLSTHMPVCILWSTVRVYLSVLPVYTYLFVLCQSFCYSFVVVEGLSVLPKLVALHLQRCQQHRRRACTHRMLYAALGVLSIG
jgi:hypothetical protein